MSPMNVLEKKRQILPRWHTYATARILGVLQPSIQTIESKPLSNVDYNQKELDWLKNKKITYASDFIGTAIVINDYSNPNVIKAAKYILKNKSIVSRLAIDIAENILSLNSPLKQDNEIILPEEIRQYYPLISNLRGDLRNYPRNPIKWVDLAFFYTIIREDKQAENCLRIALAMCSNNRFILRAVASFFLHINEPEKALHYLRNSEIIKHDPWISASEISIADFYKLRPKTIRDGRRMVNDLKFSKYHLSELFGILGTLEINAGAVKKGKKLFKNSLVTPTENSLAQAVSLNKILNFENKFLKDKLSNSFEADTRIKFSEEQYSKSIKSAEKWFQYQPLSSVPAVFASYIASVALSDFKRAIKIVEHSKMLFPEDFMLNNNHAFSLASLDRPDEAFEILNKIQYKSLSGSNKATYLATQGVIEFRLGNLRDGRQLYGQAIAEFKKLKDERGAATASLFWAREERRVNSLISQKVLFDAKKTIKMLGFNELTNFAKSIK